MLMDFARCLLIVLALCPLLLVCAWLTHRWRWLMWPLVAVPVGLGVVFASAALTARSGYAAAYNFGGTWITALGFLLAGSLLVLIKRFRRAGVAGLIAGAAVLLAFYAVYLTGHGLGLHAWKDQKQIPIPATR